MRFSFPLPADTTEVKGFTFPFVFSAVGHEIPKEKDVNASLHFSKLQ